MATKPIFSDVPEWPEQSAAPAPKGHNRPPLEETIPAEFREVLLAERPDFLQKLDDLLRAILPHDLILLGAGSGVGKTQLAMTIAAMNAASSTSQ